MCVRIPQPAQALLGKRVGHGARGMYRARVRRIARRYHWPSSTTNEALASKRWPSQLQALNDRAKRSVRGTAAIPSVVWGVVQSGGWVEVVYLAYWVCGLLHIGLV